MSDANSTAGQQPVPPHARMTAMLAAQLLTVVHNTAAPHSLHLDALLSAYASELVRHPCCWESAAKGLRHLAGQIEAMHANQVNQAQCAEQVAAAAIARAQQRPAAL